MPAGLRKVKTEDPRNQQHSETSPATELHGLAERLCFKKKNNKRANTCDGERF